MDKKTIIFKASSVKVYKYNLPWTAWHCSKYDTVKDMCIEYSKGAYGKDK